MTTPRPCPACGARMLLRRTGRILLSLPARYPRVWWCGCGYREDGPEEVDQADAAQLRREWEEENR